MFLWVRNPGPVWLGSLFQGLWQSVSQGCDLFWCSSRGHLLSSQGCWKDAVAFFFFFNFAVPGLSCGMWDLVSWPGIKLGPPTSGAWSTSDTQMIPLWCQKVKRNKKASWWGWKKVKVLVTQACPTLFIPMDNSPPGSSVHTILQAKYWSGLLFPSPGDLPNPGAEPKSPYCRHIPYHLNHQESLRVKEDWVKKLA